MWSGHDVVYLTSLSLRGPGPKLDSWWAIHYAPICSIWVHINCPGLMFFSQCCSKKTYKSTGLGAVKLSVARVCWASRGCDWPAKNQFSPLKIICVFTTFFFFRGSGAKRIAILSSVCLFWLIETLGKGDSELGKGSIFFDMVLFNVLKLLHFINVAKENGCWALNFQSIRAADFVRYNGRHPQRSLLPSPSARYY